MARPLLALLLVASLVACQEPESGTPEPAETSPNARIAPAPLLTGRQLLGRPATSTRGAASGPELQTSAEPFSLSQEPASDEGVERPGLGVTLEGEFTWPGRNQPPSLHGLDAETAARMRRALGRQVNIDLSHPRRMRFEFESDAFPLPRGSALLARRDREGHLLVWPDDHSYRVVPQGALRALLRERRLDVTPTLAAEVEEGKGGVRLDLETRSVRLRTVHGELELEQAEMVGLGASGALLCRMLLEFIAASVRPDICREDTLPLRASFRFTPPGELTLNIKSIKRREGVNVQVPPAGARFLRSGLPPRAVALLEEGQRAALRPGPPGGPTASLLLQNPGPIAAYLLVDDTPVAYVAPRSTHRLQGFRPGEHRLSSLSWFGEALQPPTTVTLPGKVLLSAPMEPVDAGAP